MNWYAKHIQQSTDQKSDHEPAGGSGGARDCFLEKTSLTEAVKDALTEEMHRKACQNLLAMRGKIDFEYTWQELRDMDDE